jgi:hypothetical protein
LVLLAACVASEPDVAGGPGTADSGSNADATTGGSDASTDAANSQDAGSDASTAWTPAVLDAEGKVALWLEGSSSNITVAVGKVTAWHDLSKNKNDATIASNGPNVDTASINGHDSVHFTANPLTVKDGPTTRFGTDPIFVTFVAKTQAPAFFYSKVLPNAGAYGSGLEMRATTLTLFDGGMVLSPWNQISNSDDVYSSASVFDDGKFHMIGLRRKNNTSYELSVDGTAAPTSTGGSDDISNVSNDIAIGGVEYTSPNPLGPYNLNIAEMVVVHGGSLDGGTGVTDDDVANVQGYLASKYGF